MMTKEKKSVIAGCIALALTVITVLVILFWPSYASVPEAAPATEPPAPPVTGYYDSEAFSLNEQGFMTYTGNYETGIDVSEYQGEIDYQAVAEAGIRFVFIKVGCRGSTEGKLYPDTMAQSHYAGAKKAGLQVGAYFFSQAVTPEEAREEARFALSLTADWELELPMVYDWEWGGEGSRTTGLSRELLTRCAEEFCTVIAQAGLAPMLYFNASQGLEQMALDTLDSYPFWLAQYDGEMLFPHRLAYWQYSCTGTVPGITGNVDLNLRILDGQSARLDK